MENLNTTATHGLEALQSPLGLAVLLLIALMILSCVLLTILVVSLGASQRSLVSRAETANKLLLQIRERLMMVDSQLPAPRRRVISEPPKPPPRRQPKRATRTGNKTDMFESVEPKRASRAGDKTDVLESVEPKRASRAGDKTDVFESIDI